MMNLNINHCVKQALSPAIHVQLNVRKQVYIRRVSVLNSQNVKFFGMFKKKRVYPLFFSSSFPAKITEARCWQHLFGGSSQNCRDNYMEVIGTTPWTGEVEPRQEQRSRVESGTETESNVGNSCRGRPT